MTLLHTLTHPAVATGGRTVERQAVRAIVMRGNDILLLYTRRYDDYSFPGGGLDAEEDPIEGLRRELLEETGAKDVVVEHVIGHFDEYRPPLKASYDVLFMRSHFYLCRVVGELGAATPEAYEVANGMVPVWIDIGKALEHNRSVLASKPPNMGLSIERETWILQYVTENIRKRCGP